MFTEQIKEAVSLGQAIFPHSELATGLETGTIDMRKFKRATFLGIVGPVGASGTVNAYLQESDNANGASGSNFATTVALTSQISGTNNTFTLEVRGDQCTKRYVKMVFDVGTAAVNVAGIGIGMEPYDHPADGADHSSIKQRIVA